jgi:hypothetical protein
MHGALKAPFLAGAVAFLLLSQAGYSFAAGPAASASKGVSQASASETPTVPNRPIVPEVTGDPTNRTGGPIYVTVTLKNVSANSRVVDNLTIRLESGADGRFDGADACNLAVEGTVTLLPNETFSQVCRFPQQTTSATEAKDATKPGWVNQKWWQSFFAADLRPSVTVKVAEVGEATFFTKPVSIKSPEWTIFVGGVIGAMMLAIFVAAERILKNPDEREQWPQTLWVTTVMGLRGGLMAVVALLLGKTTQGAGSPISLSVEDFAGGVLIGLFSYPLASWISSTLKLDGVFVGGTANKGINKKQANTAAGAEAGSKGKDTAASPAARTDHPKRD